MAEGMVVFFNIDVAEDTRRALPRGRVAGDPLVEAAWIKPLETATGRDFATVPIEAPEVAPVGWTGIGLT
jgi:hypothetical protein